MKKTIKKRTNNIWCFVAMVAIIGFLMAGCDNDDEDSGGSKGGTFTLTDIPKEYNGYYAVCNGIYYIGANEEDFRRFGGSALIYNGRVNIPLVNMLDRGLGGAYTGNDTCRVLLLITEYIGKGVPVADLTSEAVTFSNGNATKSYNDNDWVDWTDWADGLN